MRSLTKFLNITLVVLAITFGNYASLRADDAVTASAKLLDKLESQVVQKRLPNGLTVILYRRGKAPVFSASISVGVGGVDELPGHTGISHMLEHMAFKGTKTVGVRDAEREAELLEQLEQLKLKAASAPQTELPKFLKKIKKVSLELKSLVNENELDLIFREMGAVGLNATTGKETTDYFMSLPSTAFESWCQLEADRILNPVMRQFYSERDVVMEERRMRSEDDPEGKIYEHLLGKAFTVHPYGFPVIGYEKDLLSLTAKMTADFHKKYYKAENITIAVVGDVDPERDLTMLEDYFGQIPNGGSRRHDLPVEPEQTEERILELKLPANPQVLLAYKKPNYPSVDDAPLTILGELLAGSRTSLLYKRLVVEDQLLTAVDYFEAPGVGFPNLLIIQAVPRFGVTNKEAQKAVEVELEKFLSKPIPDSELTKVKRALARSYVEELSSNSGLAHSLSSTQVIYGDWRVHLSWFKEMSLVTSEDILRVGKQFLVPTRRTVAYLESEVAQ